MQPIVFIIMMINTIGDAITIVLFGRMCDPINLDKSRVAMGLYFPVSTITEHCGYSPQIH